MDKTIAIVSRGQPAPPLETLATKKKLCHVTTHVTTRVTNDYKIVINIIKTDFKTRNVAFSPI